MMVEWWKIQEGLVWGYEELAKTGVDPALFGATVFATALLLRYLKWRELGKSLSYTIVAVAVCWAGFVLLPDGLLRSATGADAARNITVTAVLHRSTSVFVKLHV